MTTQRIYTMKHTPTTLVPASTAPPAVENTRLPTTDLQVDTSVPAHEPVADDDSPTPTATTFAVEPLPALDDKPDSDVETACQPPSYEQSTSRAPTDTSLTSSRQAQHQEAVRQAALRRGAPANSSASSTEDSNNGIADLLSRFAAMLFPKYAPPPAQVVVLGDDEAPVEFLVKELIRPLLGPEVDVSTVAMVRGLSYLTAKGEKHHVTAFPKVEGFMHKKVEHTLQNANQIYYVIDSQRATSTPLPPYVLPLLKHVTFLCIHSLVRPEKLSAKLFTSLQLPAGNSITVLDGSSPNQLNVEFTTLWRAVGDIAREKRLDKLLEAQEKARGKATTASEA